MTRAITSDYETGRLLAGDREDIERSLEAWADIPVDMTLMSDAPAHPASCQTTLAGPVHVTGPGTYTAKSVSTLYFEPQRGRQEGWWFDRVDNRRQLPIRVSVRNVWTTARNIVLRSGAPHNYVRMVEHIIALRLGLGLDNVLIKMDSGDPPLFNEGSFDIVRAIEKTGIVEIPERPLTYWRVKEPLTIGGRNGSVLTLLPPVGDSRGLYVDCAIDFPTAIGKQRIQFDLVPESFRYGARARTNCSRAMMIYCKTLGKCFADIRNLGYTSENILVAGRNGYANRPRMMHEGKSLEAVWHRATLDLVAALSLVETGRLAGRIFSYKAGHTLDAELVTQLYLEDLLEEIK